MLIRQILLIKKHDIYAYTYTDGIKIAEVNLV